MTFDEICSIVIDDLNLTSPVAIARVGVHVNRRYRRATSSIGMNVFRRIEVAFPVATGSRYQTVEGIERITSMWNEDTDPEAPYLLYELTYEEMKRIAPMGNPPKRYANKRLDAHAVTFMLDSDVPDALTLTIEGEEMASTLSGTQEPGFSESYHDILVFGAKADELMKMEKPSLSKSFEADYERVLAELRLHATVGAWKTIVQGKNSNRERLGGWRRWPGGWNV